MMIIRIGVNIIMSDRFIDGVAAELSGTVFSSLIKENGQEDGAPIYLAFATEGRKYIENNLTRAIGTAKWVEVMKNV